MNLKLAASIVVALAALAEWLHARRCRRVTRLAFGPAGAPRRWVGPPVARVAAMGLLAWGLLTLPLMPPRQSAGEDPRGRLPAPGHCAPRRLAKHAAC
jgi:hypothetical protein